MRFVALVTSLLLVGASARAEHLWRIYFIAGDSDDTYVVRAFDAMSEVRRDDSVVEFWTREIAAKEIAGHFSSMLGGEDGKTISAMDQKNLQEIRARLGPDSTPYLAGASKEFHDFAVALEVGANLPAVSFAEQVLNAIDCRQRRYRVLSITKYEHGNVKASIDSASGWTAIPPDSVGEHLHDIMCSRKIR